MKLIIACIFSLSTFASNIGMSSMPLSQYKNALSAEFTMALEDSTNPGVQVQYLHSATKRIGFDGGMRLSSNDRFGLFLGGSYVFFKDYNNQPRFSLRGFYERESINSVDFNNFGFAPIVSKGFSIMGIHAYPYAALPTKLVIIEDSEDVQLASSLSLGVTSKLPFKNFEKIMAHIEGNINLKNTANDLSFGLSMNY